MLHILLLIMKIIGIFLVAVIGILLLAIIFVLFVPIRYRIVADGKLGAEEPLWIEIKITWLIHTISAVFSYPENTGLRIRILGIPIFNSSRKKKKGSLKDKKDKEKRQKGKENSGTEKSLSSEEVLGNEKRIGREESFGQKEILRGEESVENEQGLGRKENPGQEKILKTEENLENEQNPERKRNPFKEFFAALIRFFRKLLEAIRNIEYTIQELCGKIKSTMENIRYYANLLQGETFRSAFQNAKRQLIRILKIVRPHKCSINLLIGLDDPSSTGQIMAIYGMLYPLVGRHVFLQADFEEKIVEGDLYIKGKITVIVFLIAALKLYMDKNIRKLLKMLKREDA